MPLRLYAVLTLEASQKSSEEFQIYISYSSETFKKLKRKRISCAAWIQFAIKRSTLYVGTSLDSEADRRPHHLLHQYFQNPWLRQGWHWKPWAQEVFIPRDDASRTPARSCRKKTKKKRMGGRRPFWHSDMLAIHCKSLSSKCVFLIFWKNMWLTHSMMLNRLSGSFRYNGFTSCVFHSFFLLHSISVIVTCCNFDFLLFTRHLK